MKRLLLTGLLLMGLGSVTSYAQSGNYTDDIYFNSSDLEKQKEEDKKRAQEEAEARQRRQAREDRYTSSGSSYSDDRDDRNYGQSYDRDGYVDYDNDDYYYSTRIRRFHQPFYNVGYFSPFYNPFWYDPFWFDPYWGWSPWARPGFTVSIGFGPYWNSYGGWYAWYGYPGFFSCWNYPYYANWYGNYYSGFWNGYYAGLYNSGGAVRTINYGPRNSANYAYNASTRSAGLRTLSTTNPGTGPRLRTAPERTMSGGREAIGTPERSTRAINEAGRPVRSGNATEVGDRPSRQIFNRDADGNYDRIDRGGERPRYEAPRQRSESPRYEAPRQQRSESPRFEAPRQRNESPRQSSPRIEAPRQSTPRFEAPRISTPSQSIPRSSGGNTGGGRRR